MVRQSLQGLLGKLEERVLGLLLLEPDRIWYRSELAREMGLAPSSLQRPLARLVNSSVLKARKSGNRVYYQADIQCPVFPELRGLLAKTSGLVTVLHDALQKVPDRIEVAFVHGSLAKGMRPRRVTWTSSSWGQSVAQILPLSCMKQRQLSAAKSTRAYSPQSS